MNDLQAAFAAEPKFWTAHQQAAFLAAHKLVDDNPPGRRAAIAWKRQRSAAFRRWRSTTRGGRRQLIAQVQA